MSEKSSNNTNTKSTRVSGWKAREYVQKLLPFHNSNKQLYAQWEDDLYVVYSYGRHWPLYINWKGVWFANISKVSRTTTKHASQTHPLTQCVPMAKVDMEYLLLFGITPEHMVMAAQHKLLPEHLIPEATQARIAA